MRFEVNLCTASRICTLGESGHCGLGIAHLLHVNSHWGAVSISATSDCLSKLLRASESIAVGMFFGALYIRCECNDDVPSGKRTASHTTTQRKLAPGSTRSVMRSTAMMHSAGSIQPVISGAHVDATSLRALAPLRRLGSTRRACREHTAICTTRYGHSGVRKAIRDAVTPESDKVGDG